VSTAELRIGSDRSRSIMPVDMSWATAVAADAAPGPVHSSTMPWTT
jgi:hypothetical protein